MLKELLKDHQLFHSEFQQDYYITTKAGGTMYGQYKQALRELYKRIRGLREAYCDREKLEVEIAEQKFLSESNDNFKRRYAEIEHKRKVMQREEINRLINDTERECKRFYQQACYLKKEIGELTDEKRRKLDEEMHIYKLKEMFILDKTCLGRLSKTTYEFLHALPYKKRQQLLLEMKNENFVNWYEEYDNEFIKKLPEFEGDIKCLLES